MSCFSDKPLEHEHFSLIAFCSVLTILLGVVMICCAVHLKKEKVIINYYTFSQT